MSEFWDREAATFDDEPAHGLRDPAVRAAWSALLERLLPPAPADVADLGCGTGSLSVLLAAAGYRVRGVDLASEMVAAARAKAERGGLEIEFVQGDAAAPPYAPGSVDVVLARHVLWALPDPAQALGRWTALLRPGGRLVLIEGRWCTGSGIHAVDCQALVRRHRTEALVERLGDSTLWGRPIDDERYALLSRS